MTEVVNEIAQTLQQIDPQSIAAQALNAAINTAAHPDVITILNDLALGHKIITEFKANINNLHPSVANVIKALL